VLLPVVLTLIATNTNHNKFVDALSNLCYTKWALEAFVIANAKRFDVNHLAYLYYILSSEMSFSMLILHKNTFCFLPDTLESGLLQDADHSWKVATISITGTAV